MSWEDNPVQYTTVNGVVTMTSGGGAFAPGTYQYVQGGGGGATDPNGYGWVQVGAPPPSSATAPPSQPPPTPVHLQFSANTIGTPAALIWGRCRPAGQIIWAAGIDADNSLIDTSYLTFAASYGEPVDPGENVEILRMWANGTLFYSGGVLAVANISDADQASLAACIANMAVYHGTETQTVDPTMEGVLGVGNVPAYRGLRYIVFQDFPLSIANNSVPNISVEWYRVGVSILNVSDAMLALIEHVNLRSERGPVFAVPTVSGIDDLCYGFAITDTSSLIAHFQGHKDIYSYQIVESDPIKIIRRPVDSGLVIDLSVDEADCRVDGNAAAVTFNRANPAQLPVGVDLSYPDVDRDYDTKVQPGRYDGSPPGNALGSPSGISAMSSAYIVDATTARSLAFSMLFQMRSFASRAAFEITDLRPEVSDVIDVTTREGDQYVVLVDQQTVTKSRTNQINGKLLLTSAGAGIDGDGGRDGGSIGKKRWPAELLLADFVVSSGHIYAGYEFQHLTSINNYPSPLLKIGSSKYRDMAAADVSGANWGGSSIGIFPGTMFEDDTYVYWITYSYLIISRLPKTATTINGSIETLVIPEGAYNGGSPDNLTGWGNYGFDYRDGKLYALWGSDGKWNGTSLGGHDIKLIVVDIEAWSATAWEAHDVFTYVSGLGPWAEQVSVLDNGTVVVACQVEYFGTSYNGSRYFTASLSDLTTWTSHTSAFTIRNYHDNDCAVGNKIFLQEVNDPPGLSGQHHRMTMLDFSSGFSETVVDLTDDANVVGGTQIRGHAWASDTHVFVVCNHVNYDSADYPVIAPRRYIARRKISDGSADGGVFLDEFMWSGMDFYVFRGHYQEGKNFIHLDVYNRESTRLVQIDEDLDPATAIYWWPKQVATPSNNNFASAKTIVVGTTYAGDHRYCSTEVGEDYPPWATPTTGAYNDFHTYHNGHSQWWKFVAPSTGTATISLTDRAFGAATYFGIAVWTGSTLGSLTNVASAAPGGSGWTTTGATGTKTFAVTSGTTYYISTYRYSGTSFTDDIFGGSVEYPLSPLAAQPNLSIAVAP